MSPRSKSLALAAALSVFAGAAASARPVGVQGISVPTVPDPQIQKEAVSYADLDLSHEAGVRTLMARIHAAAVDVCSPAPEHGEWNTPYQACIKSAVDDALSQVSRLTPVDQLAMNALRRRGG